MKSWASQGLKDKIRVNSNGKSLSLSSRTLLRRLKCLSYSRRQGDFYYTRFLGFINRSAILASQYINVTDISEIVTDPVTQSAAIFKERVVTEKSNRCKCPAEFSLQIANDGRGRPRTRDTQAAIGDRGQNEKSRDKID